MNIYEKMLAITEDVQNIEKKGFNKFSQYPYVRATDVIEGCQKALIKHRVHLAVSELGVEWVSKTATDKNEFARVKSKGIFTNAEKPDEKIEVEFYAEGADTLDKAIYKAKTGGLKYLLTQQFMLVTDALQDPDQDEKPNQKQNREPQPKDTRSVTSKDDPIFQQLISFGVPGGKIRGRKINEVSLEDHKTAIDLIKKQAEGKHLGAGPAKDYLVLAEKFIQACEVQNGKQ